MTSPPERGRPSILAPIELSSGGSTAFLHALALALAYKARLTVLHVGPEHHRDVPWSRYPSVRAALAGWGRIPPDSPREAVAPATDVEVHKASMRDRDPAEGLVRYLRSRTVDLLVLGTKARPGWVQLIRHSEAQLIARETRLPTLFVQQGQPGFVDPDTGAVRLRRVLLPFADEPAPDPAIQKCASLLAASRDGDAAPATVTLLHLGARSRWPQVPELAGVEWSQERAEGDFVASILATAERVAADLVVVPDEGPQGTWEGIWGSVTERVVRRAGCPVLAIPVSA
jgi:nucleotide-binding universal stress UspA family protein